jgi:uncharacterized protein
MPNEIIEKTVAFVREKLAGAETGHDWWHIERVWKNAKLIASDEQVDMLVVELGALLHDIADPKFHDGDEEVGPQTARTFLQENGVDGVVADHVENIVRHISYKNSLAGDPWMSPELAVVQDADRLDALGAIGIARTFTYGGYKNRVLYDPSIAPRSGMSVAEYKSSGSYTTLNHFYEKLLKLKELMNTKTGKKLAEERHVFMEKYIEQFLSEWQGTK